MAGRLEGKVAVVTGAGSGIGTGIAEEFVKEGARVVAVDISGQQEEIAKRLGSDCYAVHADVSRGADVRSMLDAAVSHFGKLDVLCNNAGIDGAVAHTGEYPEEEFDRVFGVNGRGVFLGMRYAIPKLLENGGGTIVNTASMAAMVAFPGMPAYCAAKGAVAMLTKTAAAEYASRNIRVNAICPGPIRTQITDSLPPELIEGVVRATPLGRYGTPTEVGRLAVFLASDESSFITGDTILIDGGYTTL
ncbi:MULTISPECIES: SDR family NAD(P)-dependent oxidoreductase [Protofrankia]|uniref:3-oxoacyl-(Acyl-carrier-protein) reductase n=1 Tax=Candidatus Protofrankia datiscae TaxID=2716812 RepID=F8AWL4_9ACTN|nr:MULTISPECIES: SDR family oxidoreductase [Protofrankia]AEH09351.1 3-oxoacyl-(acyl-carrier-protein) reductase [Candidatus Protofrankia datiscae]